MNRFTFKTLWRMLLMLTAVVAVGLSGCGDGGGNPSGGDDKGGDNSGGGLVGDWMEYFRRYDGEITNYDMILSFRASGEVEEIGFIKIGNFWVETSKGDGTYSVRGSMIYIKSPRREEDEVLQYRVSGNYLTLTECSDCSGLTLKRVNISEVRKNLGTVYTNDPKLSASADYDALIWYSQDNEDERIRFGRYWVDGNGLYRYADNDGYEMNYYTNGDKLVLVDEDCSWDDNDERHCTVLETVELIYKITGSGRNMQLSINGDIWLSAEYDDYYNSSHRKRSVVGNVGKTFFSPPSAGVLGDSRQ